MKYDFFKKILEERKRLVFFIVFGVLILRLPTLFVEYYDIDLLTSFIYAKNYIAGLPTYENKGSLYHLILNYSFLIYEHPASFHFTGILIILLTSFFIYLFGKEIYSKKVGVLASILYGFLISSFNRQFMALNAEIIYNLFFTISFFIFYLIVFIRIYVFILLLILSLFLGSMVKFQGLFAVFAIIFYIILVYPSSYMERKRLKRYYILISFLFVVFIIFVVFDYKTFRIFITEKIERKIRDYYLYATVRGFTWFTPIKLIHRLGMLTVYHSLIWIPCFISIYRFFKNVKDEKSKYIITILLFLFFTIFMTGERLYFHYFVQVYPLASILAASLLVPLIESERLKKTIFFAFWVPVLFVFLWNTKDALIVNYRQDFFYNEGGLYYVRLILLGQDNDYLLPHPSYRKVLEYIKQNSKPSDKIFVWPVGAELTYFSGLRPAFLSLWNEYEAIKAIELKDKGYDTYLSFQKSFIDIIKNSSPDIFVDVSLSPVVYFRKYGNISSNFPLVKEYLDKNFVYKGRFDNIDLWFKK